jgi:NADH:ubiquinone oxidoreductase subunit D
MSRSVGIKRDLRLNKLETYANYYYLNFRSYTGMHGDCYDRFLIRMCEMCESTNIINQVINKLTKYNLTYLNDKSKLNNKPYTNINPHTISKYLNINSFNNFNFKDNYTSMESLINHFKF